MSKHKHKPEAATEDVPITLVPLTPEDITPEMIAAAKAPIDAELQLWLTNHDHSDEVIVQALVAASKAQIPEPDPENGEPAPEPPPPAETTEEEEEETVPA